MATLTSSWQTIASVSQITSGTTQTLTLQAYSSENTANNTSTVHTRLRILNNYWFAVSSWSATISGASGSGGYTTWDGGTTYTLCEGSYTVNHNSDGTGSAKISYNFTSTYGITSWSNSVTVTLPTIPRASKPTTSGDTAAGSAMTITTNRASSNFTHTLYYSFGSIAKTQMATSVGASYSWTVPTSLLNQIPDAQSGTGTIYCDTYSGTTLIGSTTCSFTITAPSSAAPTLTVSSYTEVGTTNTGVALTTSATGLGNGVIAGLSVKRAVCSATTKYGATLKSIKIEGGTAVTTNSSVTSGSSYTLDLSYPTSGTVTITATDSRGLTATKTYSGTYYAYIKPTINSVAITRDTNNGSTASAGKAVVTGNFWNGTIGSLTNTVTVTLKDQTNNKTYSTTIAKDSGTYTATNSATITGIAYDSSYSFLVTVLDSVKNNATSSYTLSNSKPTLWLGKNTAKVYDNLVVANAIKAAVWDGVYPVGAIYMSVNSTSPATYFGGTWERIKDTFLLSAGDTYSAGSTGGEAEHTLTVDEMPSHNHRHRQYIFNDAYSNGTKYGFSYSSHKGAYYDASSYGTGEVSFGNYPTGGDGAHNNMPPYLTVYVWKRTA